MSFRKVYNFASVYTHSTLCFSASPQCLWKSERLMFVIFYAVIKRWFHVKVGVDIVSLMWIWFSVLCCLRTRKRDIRQAPGGVRGRLSRGKTSRGFRRVRSEGAEVDGSSLTSSVFKNVLLWKIFQRRENGKWNPTYLPAWFRLVSPHLAFFFGVFESKFQICVISPINTLCAWRRWFLRFQL